MDMTCDSQQFLVARRVGHKEIDKSQTTEWTDAGIFISTHRKGN